MWTGMSWSGFLLFVLAAWTGIGALGIGLSLARRERRKALRDLGWIIAVWMAYLAILIGVSVSSQPKTVAMGQEQCLGRLCLTVIGAEARPSFLARHGERDLRVSIRMTNRSDKRLGDPGLEGYLEDSLGHSWHEIPGLSGVKLTTTLGPGESIVCAPVFRIAEDAGDLRLVLNHGRSITYRLRIGDRDSFLHAPVFTPIAIADRP
jgi:hypothetical protein